MDPRAFCRLRFSPLLATGVLVHLLREHFGNPGSIVDPMLQQCVWRNDKDTGILIESSSNDALLHVGQRPAVLVKRHAIRKVARLTFNDEVWKLGPQRGQEFGNVLQGAHTVFSIASRPAHTESLANEVMLLLTQYAPQIQQNLGFGQFQLQEIGELSQLEGSGGQYVVPTTFTYITALDWTLDRDLPPLRHVSLKVLYGL